MKKDYTLIKSILFAVGLLVIIAAAIVIYPIQHFLPWQHWIFWAVIAVLYCAIFLPMVAHTREVKDATRVFVGGAVYYRGVLIFGIVSAIILVFAFLFPVSSSLYIILECAAVVLFLLYFFLACFTSGHIGEVEEAEKDKLWSVSDLRKKAESLSARAAGLGSENKEVAQLAEKFAEDMRYLAPSEDQEALELESRIAIMLDQISQDVIYLTTNNCSVETVKTHFHELNSLYEQRKAIY